jgi:hypothetical protein
MATRAKKTATPAVDPHANVTIAHDKAKGKLVITIDVTTAGRVNDNGNILHGMAHWAKLDAFGLPGMVANLLVMERVAKTAKPAPAAKANPAKTVSAKAVSAAAPAVAAAKPAAKPRTKPAPAAATSATAAAPAKPATAARPRAKAVAVSSTKPASVSVVVKRPVGRGPGSRAA